MVSLQRRVGDLLDDAGASIRIPGELRSTQVLTEDLEKA